MIGQTLGHYRILEKLGKGGMGEVYRAEDTTLDRKVALKILPLELAENQERLDRFQREAKTLAALDHPNIVTIHTVEKAEGIRFLTMQLVEGKPLSQLVPEGGMPLERIFEIAIPLADALATAHDKGVIHRDLKPANIMLSDEGRVKVLDFGLAKLRQETDVPLATGLPTEPLTDEGKIVGTMPYMSPEQVEGKPLDHRSDIFSLGVVLYEMATGERPFNGDSPASLIMSIGRDTPPDVDMVREELPHHLGRIIAHCLEKNPRRRYQSALDVNNELTALRREVKSAVARPSSAESPTDLPPRRPRWWPLVAGAAVVVIALVALWLRQSQTLSPPPVESLGEHAPAVETQPPMIVVLPFENLGDPEEEYFADGMTEEITSRLAMVSGLRVISRTSAMQYKAERPPLKQIGEELGVDFVLEGTVRWARTEDGHGRIRITPQLIRAADDSHLWADSYDRVINDIFEVQSGIATEIIHALGVTLERDERAVLDEQPTDNVEAYQFYLLALENLNHPDWSERTLGTAVALFLRATELDPEFALAWARLSYAIARNNWFAAGHGTEWVLEARQAADRALELQPSLAEGKLALGYIHYYGERDFERALEVFLEVGQARPSDPEVNAALGYILRRMGRFEEAIERLESAVELDPLGTDKIISLAETYRRVRRYEDALRADDRAIALVPNQVASYVAKLEHTLSQSGDLEAARAIYEQIPDPAHHDTILRGIFLQLAEGDYEEALKRLSQSPIEVFEGNWAGGFVPKALVTSFAYHLAGDAELGRQEGEKARALSAAFVDQNPGDMFAQGTLAWANAMAGRREPAIRHAEAAMNFVKASRDAMYGPMLAHFVAGVFAWVGEEDRALDQIEYLLSIPSGYSIHNYRIDNSFRTLRDHPRFQALLEKYGEEAGA